MKYYKQIYLKSGVECVLRNAEASDAEAVYENFRPMGGDGIPAELSR